MPRRRLHGETQKRRKKPQTRLLKRKDTLVRVQATQQHAPFERSGEVEREDLEFLEAMRELEVRRSPWRGESAVRQQAVERVQFLADDGEQALFQRSMRDLGVSQLDGRPLADPAERQYDDPSGRAAPSAASPPADAGRTNEQPPTHADPPPTMAAPPAATAADTGARTRFADSEDDGDLMAEALAGGAFAPELKFAGAGAPPRRNGPRSGRRQLERAPWDDDDLHPDDELDLHGKTQAEAIAMVQNFLLTCQRQRKSHVLIITGRGRNSGQAGPVLKDAVLRWLELNGKPYARAYVQAPPRLGGAGALWVTLRPPERPRRRGAAPTRAN